MAGSAALRRLGIRVVSEPTYRRAQDGDALVLAAHAEVEIAPGRHVVVRAGGRTDGATIPRGAWALIAHPFAAWVLLAATVHDELCARKGWLGPGLRLTQPEVSRLFRDMLLLDGADRLTDRAVSARGARRLALLLAAELYAVRAWAMWAAVRFFGPRW